MDFSALGDQRMEWVAIGQAVRCGGRESHSSVRRVEVATNAGSSPGYFGIGALDVVSLELTFGFDLDTDQDHYEAPTPAGSRLAGCS